MHFRTLIFAWIFGSAFFARPLLALSLSAKVLKLGVPVAKKEVELVGFFEGSEKFRSKSLTNQSGNVRFEVPSKEAVNLVARVENDGLQYFSPVYQSNSLPKEAVILKIYDAKESDPRLHLKESRISFKLSKDRALRVEQDLIVENLSSFTIIGKKNESFRMELPKSAYDFQALSYFEEKELKEDDGILSIDRPFPPGIHSFSIAFSIPVRNADTLEEKFSLPLSEVSVLNRVSHAEVSVNFPLEKSGSKFFDGEVLPLYSGRPSSPTETLRFEIEGIPFAWPWSKILSPIGIFAFLGLFWFSFFRNQDRVQRSLSASKKDRLLKKLLEIEKLKSWGNLNSEDYEGKRIQILKELIPFYESESGSS